MNLLYYIIMAVLCLGCVNKPTQIVNETCEPDSVVPTETRTAREKTTFSSSVNGKTAIGNIKFGISKSDFKKEKRVFLENFPYIGDLEIKEVIPIFDNGILICVIIHSKGIKLVKPNSQYYIGGDEYERSSLVRLYDKKYAAYKIEKGHYLKNGISYEIILNSYITPENMYKDLTNRRGFIEILSDLHDFESMRSSDYIGYNYLIISNQLYLDSLKRNNEEKLKEINSKKEKHDYDAI